MSQELAGLPCAEQTRVLGAAIAGTAVVETWAWICVEVRAAWGPKGLGDTALPQAVEAHLRAAARLPGARVQLLRRPQRAAGDPVVVLLADSRPGRERMVELRLESLDALVSHDLGAFFTGGLELGSPVEEPRYLVCTHGRRDLCCARLGVGVWSGLDQAAPEHTWQTTHLGGHRFAATLVVLPEGVCFGQVEASEASALHEAWEQGRIYDPARVRGRTALAAREQAAEVLSGGMVRRAPAIDHDGPEVSLAWSDGVRSSLSLEQVELGVAEASCGSGKLKPVTEWRRVEQA